VWSLAGVKLQRLLAPRDIETRTLAAYFTTYQHEYDGQLAGAPLRDYGLAAVAPVWFASAFAKLFFRPGEHALLRDVERIIIHWEASREILLDEIRGLDSDKIVRLPFYVELYDREASAPVAAAGARDVVQLCAISRQDPRKALHVLLKALQLLARRGCAFSCEIIGNGPFLEANRRLAHALGLDRQVHFRGFVTSARDCLEAADIFVMSSCEEGASSLSLLEAMLCGLAVASTDCDGVPEDIQHGENGLLAPVGDHEALAECIEKLIRDEKLRRRLAARARESYHEKYAFTAMQDGIRDLLAAL